jgi:hypothetical protein
MRAVNLIPAESRSGASVGAGRSEGAAYAILGTVAGLAAMALLYGLASHQVTTGQAEANKLAARAEQTQSAAAQLTAYTSFVALRQARTQAVDQLVSSRFDWAHAFHEFGRVLPASTSITSLTGTISSGLSSAPGSSSGANSGAAGSAAAGAAGAAGGSAVTSATPPGSLPSFTLAGCSTSQTAVAETINRLRLIDGVSSVVLQSSTKGGGTGASAGGCVGTEPVFNMLVTFQPLPTAAAATSSVAAVANASAPTTSTGASKGAGTLR